jgi:hypothetical protein
MLISRINMVNVNHQDKYGVNDQDKYGVNDQDKYGEC